MTEYLRERWKMANRGMRVGWMALCGAVCVGAAGLCAAWALNQAEGTRRWTADLPEATDAEAWACIAWGNPAAVDTEKQDACAAGGPRAAWVNGAYRVGGTWRKEAPWGWVGDSDGACLVVDMNRQETPEELVAVVDLLDAEDCELRVDVLDASGKPLAEDAVGDLMEGTGRAARRCFVLALANSPETAAFRIRRIRGVATVYAVTLFGVRNARTTGTTAIPESAPPESGTPPGPGITVSGGATAEEWITRAEGVRGEYRDVRSAKKEVLRGVEESLASNGAAATNATVGQWARLTEALNADLLPPERKRLAQRLRTLRAADATALGRLPEDDARRLVETVWALDGTEGRAILRVWFADRNLWGRATAGTCARFAFLAGEAKNAKDEPEPRKTIPETTLKDLDRLWTEADATGALTLEDMKNVAIAYARLWRPDAARSWGWKVYEKALGTPTARDSADAATLELVAETMAKAGLIGGERDCEEYAAVLVRLGRENGLCGGKHAQWADPIRTAGTVGILRESATDTNGYPRRELCKTICWAARNAGTLPAWRGEAQAAAQRYGVGDARGVEWRLADAYAAQLIPKTPEPARRAHGLREAWRLAGTAAARSAVAEETLAYFRDECLYEQGRRFAETASRELAGNAGWETAKNAFEGDAAAWALTAQRRTLQREWVGMTGMLELFERNLRREEVRQGRHTAALRTSVDNARRDLAAK